MPRTCILTGEPGENADDCTTHEHERHTVYVTYMFAVEVEDPDDKEGIAEEVADHVNSVSDPFGNPVKVESDDGRGHRKSERA